MTTLNWTKPTNYDDVDDDVAGDNFVENNEDSIANTRTVYVFLKFFAHECLLCFLL